jgi:hypothetical protein
LSGKETERWIDPSPPELALVADETEGLGVKQPD